MYFYKVTQRGYGMFFPDSPARGLGLYTDGLNTCIPVIGVARVRRFVRVPEPYTFLCHMDAGTLLVSAIAHWMRTLPRAANIIDIHYVKSEDMYLQQHYMRQLIGASDYITGTGRGVVLHPMPDNSGQMYIYRNGQIVSEIYHEWSGIHRVPSTISRFNSDIIEIVENSSPFLCYNGRRFLSMH